MRVLVAAVVSFTLALMVGLFMLRSTSPPHHAKHTGKALKLEGSDVPSLEMLPALPSLRTTRIEVPSAAGEARPEQKPRAGVSARTVVGTTVSPPPARPAAWRRGTTAPSPARGVAGRIPGASSEARPHRVSQVVIATVVPESQASRPAATSTALPAVAPAPKDTNPSASPISRRQVPITGPAPDTAQTPKPDVTPVDPSGSAAPGAYVLGTGDQIEVTVPHLAVTVTLGPEGVIALPLIGPVKAAGKTTAQLASELTNMYSKVLDAPSVTVFVREYRLRR